MSNLDGGIWCASAVRSNCANIGDVVCLLLCELKIWKDRKKECEREREINDTSDST